MWKTVILLMCLSGTTLATPVVGLKKNMEIVMKDEMIKTDEITEDQMVSSSSSNEKSEIAMTTLNLPSNATSIRADIVDGFSCKNRAYGYYADVENDCQIFHVCMPVVYADGKENTFRWSFICPEETVFSQDSFTCMREEDMSFGCEDSVKFYELNRNFGIVDSSMEMQSNEVETNSDNMMSDMNAQESMTELKQPTMLQEPQTLPKEEKIQKRVDDFKVTEAPKSTKTHKKKNNLRKAPIRKVTTTTVIPKPTATEQPIKSITPTTSIPLENEITTAKVIEKLTTKKQRFTRRPDINKENKKKLEQVQKIESITVGPVIKDSTKKPFKTESITMQKRKRPQLPSSNLKHKFNGEEKQPLKNTLKTSEIIKVLPNQEQDSDAVITSSHKLNKKDQIRPPIPEPILIRVEEQPAKVSKPEPEMEKNIPQPIQQTEIAKPELVIPFDASSQEVKPVLQVTSIITESENNKKNEKNTIPVIESVQSESNKEINEEYLKKNISPSLVSENKYQNDPTGISVNDPNQITVIKLNHDEKIASSQEHVKDEINLEKTNENNVKEESMNLKKEELLEDNIKKNNNKNNDNGENKDEINLNKNDENAAVTDNNQSGIDQQSIIINLISSLVNAENSKVNDSNSEKIDNSQYVLPVQQNIQESLIPQAIIIDNSKNEQPQAQQLNNEEKFEITTNSIVSDISDQKEQQQQQQQYDEIKNSDHDIKIKSTNDEADKPTGIINLNKVNTVEQQNEFDAMQKLFHKQHELYNHMTHIPVKLLTDDEFENIHTKSDLSNSDAINVIQRIEELLQNEVKDENQSPPSTADVQVLKHDDDTKIKSKLEEHQKSDIPKSSEEIKPIYHRTVEPLNLNMLKDSGISVDENIPIVKDAVEEVAKLEHKKDGSVLEPNKIEIPLVEKFESEPMKDESEPLKVEQETKLESIKEEKLKTVEPTQLEQVKEEIVKIVEPAQLESIKEDTLKKIELAQLEQVKEENLKTVELPQIEPVKEETFHTAEPLQLEPVHEEILKTVEPSKIELPQSEEPHQVEVQVVPSEIESLKIVNPKEEKSSIEVNRIDESKTILENLELQSKDKENISELKSEIKKLEDSSSDGVRTSSRSLKYRTRIIDPRKRRFLFKADA